MDGRLPMKTREYPLRLLAPCFLGDARQSGAWRTPPFKALLREWWRIATASSCDYDHLRLREQEGILFGNAWLKPINCESRFCKSKIRLALAHWNAGKMTAVGDDLKVRHGEVKFHVGSQLYLGYGPITFDKVGKKSTLKANAALQANETNTLALAWPEAEKSIPNTLQLIDWFGTVGGRSRNGWGSLALGLEPLAKDHPQFAPVLRDLRDCLKLDWPHAIGEDAVGPLVWHSAEAFDSWQDAMRFLACTKIGFRTNLHFNGGQPHRQAQERHLLAYPVTHHAIAGMSRDARLANQLRFKLFRDTENKLRARIYHTPHASPLPMPNNLNQIAVWQGVHAWLDDPAHKLCRLGDAA